MQVKNDFDAHELYYDDYYHSLGHKSEGNALRTLVATIPEADRVIIKYG